MNGDQHIEAYLRRLEAELADLPRERCRELVAEIEGHIAEARAAGLADDEAAVLNLLDRIGDPAAIAAEAYATHGEVPQRSLRWQEMLTVALLLVGGVVLPVVGWIVGAVLLWGSEAWTRREKLVGTLVVPGGLLAAVFLVSGTTYVESCVETGGPGGGVETTCTGGPSQLAQILGIVLVIVLFVAPIVSAVYLLRRARGRSSGHAGSAVRESLA